jgi:hypothetical protein
MRALVSVSFGPIAASSRPVGEQLLGRGQGVDGARGIEQRALLLAARARHVPSNSSWAVWGGFGSAGGADFELARRPGLELFLFRAAASCTVDLWQAGLLRDLPHALPRRFACGDLGIAFRIRLGAPASVSL